MSESTAVTGSGIDRSQAQARIGSTIDQKWRLDALIGLGGMAAVFSATHTSGRRGAFKVMHRRLAHDAQLVTRFVREQSISAKVRHPACIDIHGAGMTDDGVPLLVMELLEGETLEQRLGRTGRLAISEGLHVGELLLDFLVACHGAGVVHRDLKPANLFLLSGARMKVLDFGVARESTRRQTNRRLAIGTPSYMSPEQARGAMDVDLRADLFAVGAILYRVIIGRELRDAPPRSPLPGNAPTPTVADDVGAATEPAPSIARRAPGLPAMIARAIDRALSWQRDERWANAESMLTELRAARSSIPAERLSTPAELQDEDDEETGDRPTHPGTPSAIRILQEAEQAASADEAMVSSSTPSR